MARVSTYLNFPGTAEKAFIFYKSIFGGDYIDGIMRFGDFPPPPGAPEMDEQTKNMVMNIQLAILGGHVIMATDAPSSMGFSFIAGNNVHIQLETDSKEETDNLFTQLSSGGIITMPLEDTFWGAYYGSCTDKFGVHWMLNFMKS